MIHLATCDCNKCRDMNQQLDREDYLRKQSTTQPVEPSAESLRAAKALGGLTIVTAADERNAARIIDSSFAELREACRWQAESLESFRKKFNAPSNCQALDAIDELRESAATVLKGFEEGVFVRDTSKDAKPGWAVKLLPYIVALGKLKKFTEPTTPEAGRGK